MFKKSASIILVLAICFATAFGCMLNVSAAYSGTYTYSGGIANYGDKQASVNLTFELTEGFAAGDFAIVNTADGDFADVSVEVKGGTTKDNSTFDVANIAVKFNVDKSDKYLGHITFWTKELKYYTSIIFELTYTMKNFVENDGVKYNVDIDELVIATKFSNITPTFTGNSGYIHSHYFEQASDTECNICGEIREAITNKWVNENGVWYYYDEFGNAVTGWLNLDVWYYFDSTGVMLTGWQVIDSNWYYFNADGSMATDWLNLGGTWYYLDASGAMLTGWQVIGGNWYYFNTSGAMATDWLNLGGTWYYLDASGAMLTGWQVIGGNWYYFNADGSMASGWLNLGGTWYYLDASGAMLTGWQVIGSNWYYFNADGSMASNCWIGNYWLSASGAML